MLKKIGVAASGVVLAAVLVSTAAQAQTACNTNDVNCENKSTVVYNLANNLPLFQGFIFPRNFDPSQIQRLDAQIDAKINMVFSRNPLVGGALYNRLIGLPNGPKFITFINQILARLGAQPLI